MARSKRLHPRPPALSGVGGLRRVVLCATLALLALVGTAEARQKKTRSAADAPAPTSPDPAKSGGDRTAGVPGPAQVAGPAGSVGSGASAAQEPLPAPSESIAVFNLHMLGMTPEVEGLFRSGLREALAHGGFKVVPDAEVDAKLSPNPQLLSCLTRSCYNRVAWALNVRRVVEGTIERPQRSTYTLHLQVRDLATGRLDGAVIEERCDICSTEEARQMVLRGGERLSRAAREGPSPPPIPDTGILQVDSQPLGAEVVIDGKLQEDRTPAAFLLAVGVHSLALRARGYRSIGHPVEIRPGQKMALDLELIAIPPRRPWLTALGITSTVGAVGLGVGSGVLFYYDGKPDYMGACLPPASTCPNKYDTLAAGIATAAGAGLLAIGAGIAFYYDYTPPPRKRFITPADGAVR